MGGSTRTLIQYKQQPSPNGSLPHFHISHIRVYSPWDNPIGSYDYEHDHI